MKYITGILLCLFIANSYAVGQEGPLPVYVVENIEISSVDGKGKLIDETMQSFQQIKYVRFIDGMLGGGIGLKFYSKERKWMVPILTATFITYTKEGGGWYAYSATSFSQKYLLVSTENLNSLQNRESKTAVIRIGRDYGEVSEFIQFRLRLSPINFNERLVDSIPTLEELKEKMSNQ